MFFFTGSYSLEAMEAAMGDQEFNNELDNIKNPFDDGYPKPVVIVKKRIHHEVQIRPINLFKLRPRILFSKIQLPALKLQGVIVGEGIQEAIINDQVVALHGTIKGARVDAVTKDGVELFFKGKKFLLKVD
jgi:hypothetical protein